MTTLEKVSATGRCALTQAHLPADLLRLCDTALARPGRLFSTAPVASRLFLAWGQMLLAAVPPAWLHAAVACEFVLAGCDLIDRHTDDLYLSSSHEPRVASSHTGTLPAGISLLVLAQDLMSGLQVTDKRRIPAAQALARMTRRALAAHHRDVILRTQPLPGTETAVSVLRQRSGELVAIPCVCAALLAGASVRCVVLARRFGRALGCAGQLEDDQADRTEDLATGRKTLPLLLAQLEPRDARVVETATAVLTHRFLEEAAEALRALPSLAPYDSEALWDLLPSELRTPSHCSPARLPVSS